MKTHVFIVNDDTFPTHLKYLFAGTGASYGTKKPIWMDWHIGLLSDIKRVRSGDLVLFYIEGTKETNGFYGIFKIAAQNPVVFHQPYQNGFLPDLSGNKLIYRTLIEPYEVYSEGVPEWEALDKLPVYATEIQWSLIYRKLKGKRGCTPLLPWEAERLIDMIRNKNSGRPIANTQFTKGFDWDKKNRKIVITDIKLNYPLPRNYNFDPLEAICYIQNNQKSFESYLKSSKNFEVSPRCLRMNRSYENYLQLYFIENIEINPALKPIVGDNVIWFGNEVACGVGMQKIDILTICKNGGKKEYRLIELKDEPIQPEIVHQIEYYVNWASQNSGRHLDGAFSWNIQPVIVAPPHSSKNWQSVVNALRDYNQKRISLPILYFEFDIDCKNKTINFQLQNY